MHAKHARQVLFHGVERQPKSSVRAVYPFEGFVETEVGKLKNKIHGSLEKDLENGHKAHNAGMGA